MVSLTKSSKHILHICNSWVDPDNVYTKQIINQFPSELHSIIYVQDTDKEIKNINSNIRIFYCPNITPYILSNINATVNIFYDIESNIMGGEHPWDWLRYYSTIHLHTRSKYPWINNMSLEIFETEELKQAYYNILNKMPRVHILNKDNIKAQFLSFFWDVL